MHRFTAPAWWDHLEKHVSADMRGEEAFKRVVNLKVNNIPIIIPSSLMNLAFGSDR